MQFTISRQRLFLDDDILLGGEVYDEVTSLLDGREPFFKDMERQVYLINNDDIEDELLEKLLDLQIEFYSKYFNKIIDKIM